mmetsp:Transcript_2789/g.7326  ORF Transcript_2789/g.7326 Transcript_2789/m.7326 type:complete len:238 (+) Transcript_2789:644-1357(+)
MTKFSSSSSGPPPTPSRKHPMPTGRPNAAHPDRSTSIDAGCSGAAPPEGSKERGKTETATTAPFSSASAAVVTRAASPPGPATTEAEALPLSVASSARAAASSAIAAFLAVGAVIAHSISSSFERTNDKEAPASSTRYRTLLGEAADDGLPPTVWSNRGISVIAIVASNSPPTFPELLERFEEDAAGGRTSRAFRRCVDADAMVAPFLLLVEGGVFGPSITASICSSRHPPAGRKKI